MGVCLKFGKDIGGGEPRPEEREIGVWFGAELVNRRQEEVRLVRYWFGSYPQGVRHTSRFCHSYHVRSARL